MNKKLSTLTENEKVIQAESGAEISPIVQETTDMIVNRLAEAINNIFKHYNKKFAKSAEKYNKKNIEKTREKVKKM